MQITFHGAAQEVTGSMHLLEVNGHRVLLDCGMFQGRRVDTYERNLHFPFEPKDIDALILSHAHIDHCGNLPNLCVQGFDGNICCTFGTRDLASIMLEDSAGIQKDDAEFVSKKRAKHGLPPVQPLYTAADAEKAIRQFVAINEKKGKLGPMVLNTFEVTYYNQRSEMVAKSRWTTIRYSTTS